MTIEGLELPGAASNKSKRLDAAAGAASNLGILQPSAGNGKVPDDQITSIISTTHYHVEHALLLLGLHSASIGVSISRITSI